jgi:hypothetical protein
MPFGVRDGFLQALLDAVECRPSLFLQRICSIVSPMKSVMLPLVRVDPEYRRTQAEFHVRRLLSCWLNNLLGLRPSTIPLSHPVSPNPISSRKSRGHGRNLSHRVAFGSAESQGFVPWRVPLPYRPLSRVHGSTAMRLTAKAIELAQPAGKEYIAVRGDKLYLCIHPSGGKNWLPGCCWIRGVTVQSASWWCRTCPARGRPAWARNASAGLSRSESISRAKSRPGHG